MDIKINYEPWTRKNGTKLAHKNPKNDWTAHFLPACSTIHVLEPICATATRVIRSRHHNTSLTCQYISFFGLIRVDATSSSPDTREQGCNSSSKSHLHVSPTTLVDINDTSHGIKGDTTNWVISDWRMIYFVHAWRITRHSSSYLQNSIKYSHKTDLLSIVYPHLMDSTHFLSTFPKYISSTQDFNLPTSNGSIHMISTLEE